MPRPTPQSSVDAGRSAFPAFAPAANVARDREARLRGMVDRYVDFVARVLRNAGTPDAEIDDEVQRTFITAARRLDDVRPGAEKGFLFKIALNLAAHARRTLARRREVLAEEAPERNETFPTPEQLTDQKRMRQTAGRCPRSDGRKPARRVRALRVRRDEHVRDRGRARDTAWDGGVAAAPRARGISRARRLRSRVLRRESVRTRGSHDNATVDVGTESPARGAG